VCVYECHPCLCSFNVSFISAHFAKNVFLHAICICIAFNMISLFVIILSFFVDLIIYKYIVFILFGMFDKTHSYSINE